MYFIFVFLTFPGERDIAKLRPELYLIPLQSYLHGTVCVCTLSAATLLSSECELQGSGGTSLDAAALCGRLQPRGGGGVPAASRRRRPCQRQRVSAGYRVPSRDWTPNLLLNYCSIFPEKILLFTSTLSHEAKSSLVFHKIALLLPSLAHLPLTCKNRLVLLKSSAWGRDRLLPVTHIWATEKITINCWFNWQNNTV